MEKKIIAVLGLCALSLNSIQAQVFNFDDGTLTDTTGEVTLVPFNVFGSGQIPEPASGTLDASGGELRLSATHFGNGTAFDPTILGTILGPTRIGFINPTPYQDFEVSVVITDPGTIGAEGPIPFTLIGARLTDVGPGTTKGYGVQFARDIEGKRSISLVKIVNESTEFLLNQDGTQQAFSFDHNEESAYLITFTGRGSTLQVSTDDLSTEIPGFTFSATDTEFAAGATGIVLATSLSEPEQPITAAYDNFTSRPAPELPEAPELTIQQAVKLTWPMVEGTFQLEAATDLNGAWSRVDTPVMEVDGMLQATVLRDETNRYFRLRPIAE